MSSQARRKPPREAEAEVDIEDNEHRRSQVTKLYKEATPCPKCRAAQTVQEDESILPQHPTDLANPSPDEHPFTPLSKLPKPIIPAQHFPHLLWDPAASHPSTNVNPRILDFYINHIVPGITTPPPGSPRTSRRNSTGSNPLDDGNYGSAATRDVEVLQALSRRIHFGMFVSESKFRSAPADFIPHIQANPPNTTELERLITKPEVERKLLIRLGNKARVYGAEMDDDGHPIPNDSRIDIDAVVGLYRDYVIPLTKDVEVDYLVHRLDGVDGETIERWRKTNKYE